MNSLSNADKNTAEKSNAEYDKSSAEWSYPHPDLLPGRLLKRYKRFLADIELDTGETITAHCPNTGPMTGVSAIDSPVMVSRSNNPKRKLAYTWELIEVHDNGPVWTGINTAIPNRAIRSALESCLFPSPGQLHHRQTRSPLRHRQQKPYRFFTHRHARRPTYLRRSQKYNPGRRSPCFVPRYGNHSRPKASKRAHRADPSSKGRHAVFHQPGRLRRVFPR